ncbi:DUF1801 domain-containing protein [Adhaeribacter soli]|uniref:DUF1801 domain-containing protein n=1 Tax=Adhaeribacter soli TaxID=2607655 RepID=A0A5N1IUS9_9BACT|nr:DUF1801 domain-containing protein [Adhaeribacter soli]KAA9332866.1 DUF1801 domain-containing protein [Adhaeribacter soli]
MSTTLPTKKAKPEKKTGPEQVAAFLENLVHPLKPEIEEVRKIILNTNSQLTEHIKWNAPSFCLQGDDRITFNLHGKDCFRLIFHCGVKKTGTKEQLFQDESGLLTWVAPDRATATFKDMADVKRKQDQLKVIIKKWLEVTP